MVARFASTIFALAATLAATAASAQNPAPDAPLPLALPEPIQTKGGLAVLPDTRLWYWDTGGDGPPIVLVHPATGSALIWGYQQPAFAKAGYRVIGYSRRSYYNSDPLVADRPGIASEDLHHLADYLGLAKFHLVGSAAGGGIAADYAVSHPDRLLSLIVASNPSGLSSGPIATLYERPAAQGISEPAAGFPRARAVLPRRQSGRRKTLARARAQGDHQPAVPAARREQDHRGDAQSPAGADAADLRRGRPRLAAGAHPHGRGANPVSRARHCARGRALHLLGAARHLQSRGAGFCRAAFEVSR